MKLTLLLLKDKTKLTKKGFPVVVIYRSEYKQKRINLKLYSSADHWNFLRQEPSPAHPDYLNIMQKVVDVKRKMFELEQFLISDFNKIKTELLRLVDTNFKKKQEDFYAFADELIQEMRSQGRYSNAIVYNTVKVQLKKYRDEVAFDDIDYNFLIGFVNQKKIQGLRPSSIHNYLRTLRAIYNQAVLRKGIKDTKPFKGVFNGLRVRSHSTNKKYLLSEDIRILEKAELKGFKDFVRDLFLLQFYLGGQDLKDIYFMRYDSMSSDRIYFKRSKVSNGYTFDLAITDKVRDILIKHRQNSEYILPYRKDEDGYKTFRRRYGRYLIAIQKELGLTVKPLGGNLGIKVARHTFANIGKRKGIEEDMLRELMGHERDDVDNYYKDRYPEQLRDKAQLKIINDE